MPVVPTISLLLLLRRDFCFRHGSAGLDVGAGEADEDEGLLLAVLDCCCARCLSTVAFQSLTSALAWSATFLSECERNLPTATPSCSGESHLLWAPRGRF